MPADRSRSLPGTPKRFTIIPDDHHVPYAGITGDRKQFFLSNQLFVGGSPRMTPFIGLFTWDADDGFESVVVGPVRR